MFHVKHKKTGDILSHRSIILPSFYSLYLSTLDPLSGVHLSFLCCGRVDISEGIKPRFSNQSEVCVVRRNIPVDFLSCARFTRNFMSLGPMPMFEHSVNCNSGNFCLPVWIWNKRCAGFDCSIQFINNVILKLSFQLFLCPL